MENTKTRELSAFLTFPVETDMDMTEVHRFWQKLRTKEVYTALWPLLMVLFEIVHEWKVKEIKEAHDVGMGTDPRKAILWHHTEFMTEAHKKRIRTSRRRQLSATAAQSVDSAINVQQRARAMLQENADEERKIMILTTIQNFVKSRIFPKIRLGEWSQPTNPDKWRHYKEMYEVAGEYWEHNRIWDIIGKKKPFQQMVWRVFCDMLRTTNLTPYHGSIRASSLSCLKEVEEDPDGDADCISGVGDAVQGDGLEAKRKFNLEKAAETLSATTVLQKMSWRHSCPNTTEHWVCFKAIMTFCREFIRNPQLHAVQDFMLKEDFPTSMRAWCIMPWAALKVLEQRREIPRFLAAPTDRKIRDHANLAPDFYQDPGNKNLDLTFYVLSLWEFMTPMVLPEVLKLSWKEYGSRGEKSSDGPMNFRGNVLEALLGYCHEQSMKVSGYHAGRLKEPEQASSSA